MSNVNQEDVLDMSIRIMDRLAKMKVLNKKQSADLNYVIQDAITEEIEVVINRKSLNENIKNNSINVGELEYEKGGKNG